MTDTPDSGTPESTVAKKRAGGLSTMLIADLKSMAAGLGVAGAGSMKKAQLVDAIKGASSVAKPAPQITEPAPRRRAAAKQVSDQPATGSAVGATPPVAAATPPDAVPTVTPPPVVRTRTRSRQRPQGEEPLQSPPAPTVQAVESADSASRETEPQEKPEPERSDQGRKANQNEKTQYDKTQYDKTQQDKAQQEKAQQERGESDLGQNPPGNQVQNTQNNQNTQNTQGADGEVEGEGRRNRRRRGRDRNRTDQQGGGQQGQNGPTGGAQSGGSQNGGGGQNGGGQNSGGQNGGGQQNGGQQRHQREPDTSILEDDVLVPAAGILDVLDNYAFVRTSGYLPGVEDVYVSLSMVRKYGLRRGDALMGQVRQPREGERKEKFNPMVRIDSVNGADPEAAKDRVEYAALTPVHPSERLRLETGATNLVGRVIDVVAPIGKGQRGLIVSPAKAGKTRLLQSIADSITANHPECHLMVVLVDERPEEVTDFERSIKGEVIASTFDRPAADHTVVAELAIERAKRLVELGHDVVLLLDGITRLGRAYNLSAQASGRLLPGGIDAAALHPPKRFFGAARNIENGGSLTVLATALVESGSTIDEVILDEVRGAANLEIRLRGDLADKLLFPAVDVVSSGTGHEELLMSAEELAIVWKLRRVLAGLDHAAALEMLLSRLRESHTNIEFLMQVQKTTERSLAAAGARS